MAPGDGTLSFEELLEAHEAMVWTLCLRMTGSRELAQDAHQECFIRVWRSLSAFRGEAKPSTWIWRIAVRCCRELLERERRLPLDVDEDALGAVQDLAPGADRLVESADSTRFLLAFLKPRERALVHLFYNQELSCEEIAEVLEMKSGAVRVALHRARETMREGWERAHGRPQPQPAPSGSRLTLAQESTT
jgi:RNA polymerase sigma-70 factor (ECF subfamily)